MVVLKLRQDLFHDYLPEESTFGADLEFLAVEFDCRGLAFIEINHLAVLAYKSSFLLAEILWINRS